MRLCKIIVFRMRPKLQIGCSIDGKKGKLCIGKVYFFFSKKIVVIYQILFLIPLNKKLSGRLHTITISKIFKLFNYSKFSTLEVSKFTRVCKVENVPTNSFHFFTRTTYLSFKMIHRVETFNNCSWSLLFIQCSFCFVHL